MSEEQDPMKAAIDALKRHQQDINNRKKCAMEAQANLSGESERVEKEVLMQLWRDVGNSPHSYYIAMNAIYQFVKSLNAIREIDEVPSDLHVLICRAIAKCCEMDAVAIEVCEQVKAKYNIE